MSNGIQPTSTRGSRDRVAPTKETIVAEQTYVPAIERYIMQNIVNKPANAEVVECDVVYGDAQTRFESTATKTTSVVAGYSDAESREYMKAKEALRKHRNKSRVYEEDTEEVIIPETKELAIVESKDNTFVEMRKLEIQAQNDISLREYTLAMEDLKIRKSEVDLQRDLLNETKKENELVLIRGLVEKGCSQEEIEAFLVEN